ncbi:PIN domain protein [Acidilutibacter cellobiosedens]|uniref:PIN domain protein n=2 Tax=Acidilutibacter cellobiosedens TaxID=2507161 RepID=A0A410QDB1_9FIRM|nr:PIN domain protein [Acidilutibacter cellobiosedens]
MKIYLDNCCFNRPFDDQTQLKIYLESQAKLFIQHKIISKEYKLVWSFILEYENGQNPYEIRKDTIIKWKSLASEIIIQNEEIIKFAETLNTMGIKSKDALHVACAAFSNCDYFITTDKKLLNLKIKEVKISSPIDFVIEMEG